MAMFPKTVLNPGLEETSTSKKGPHHWLEVCPLGVDIQLVFIQEALLLPG